MDTQSILCTVLSKSRTDCSDVTTDFDVDLANNNIDLLIACGVKKFTLCLLDRFSFYCAERIIELTNEIPDRDIRLAICNNNIATLTEGDSEYKTDFYSYRFLVNIAPHLFSQEELALFAPNADSTYTSSHPDVKIDFFDTPEEILEYCETVSDLIVQENGSLVVIHVPKLQYSTVAFEEGQWF